MNGFETANESSPGRRNMQGDEGLIAAAIGGDHEAFAVVMQRYALRLALFIRRNASPVLRADCSEEDLLQSVMLSAWQSLHEYEYRGPGSFHAWLVQIARFAISGRVKYVRAKGRDRARRLDPDIGTDSHTPDFAESMTSICSRVGRRESLQNLEHALLEMPEIDRRVVELSFLEGLTIREIATRLELSKSSVWDRLRVAMSDLRSYLRD